jgi:hypothetical protein
LVDERVQDWRGFVPALSLAVVLHPATDWRHDAPGRVVRSALGASMRHALCVRPETHCEDCQLGSGCLYPSWFALDGARPWWLHVPPQSRFSDVAPLCFEWRFFGHVPRTSLLVEALCRLGSAGLGPDRVRQAVSASVVVPGGRLAVLDRGMQVGSVPVDGTLADHRARLPEGEVWLGFRQVQLRRRGALVRRPDAATLIGAAMMRVRGLCRAHADGEPMRWPTVEGLTEQCRDRGWVGLAHRSRRQGGQSIDLSGAEGVFRLDGRELGPWRDLLEVMPFLHVGRWTSAGLGAIEFYEPGEED